MKFGVKVVDKTSTKNSKRLNKFMNDYKKLNGLELAIYNNSNDYIKGLNYHILHTNVLSLSIENFLFNASALHYYIYNDLLEILAKEKIKNIVIHIAGHSKANTYSDHQLRQFITFCSELSLSEDINIFVENTFDTVEFMEKIFRMDQDNVLNFCFDIGHAKALSKENTFSDWLNFIDNFYGDVHIHFHTNRGERDEHLPLTITTNNWTSDFHEGKDYYQMGRELISALKNRENSSLILETYPHFMKSNLEALIKMGVKF